MLASQTNMRILLADYYDLFREGMRHMLTSFDEVGEIIELIITQRPSKFSIKVSISMLL